MKKIYNKLQDINSRITDCEKEIKTVKLLPFYNIFSREAQREKDIEALQELLNKLLQQKLEILNELKSAIKEEKLTVSAMIQHSVC